MNESEFNELQPGDLIVATKTSSRFVDCDWEADVDSHATLYEISLGEIFTIIENTRETLIMLSGKVLIKQRGFNHKTKMSLARCFERCDSE